MMFGEKIQRLRKVNGLSQEQLAARINVSRQAISKWEMGAIPDIDNVVKLSAFFDCSLDFLMNNDVDDVDCCNISDRVQPIKKNKSKLAANCVLKIIAILPVILLTIVWVIAKVVEFPITRQDSVSGNFYTGFSGFVDYFQLYGFVYCCIAVWIVSIVAIMIQQLYVQPLKKPRKFICCYLARFTLIIVGTVLWIYGFLNPWKFYWTTQTVIFVSIVCSTIIGTSIATNYFSKEGSFHISRTTHNKQK